MPRFEPYFDLLPDAVLAHAHGRWIYANPAACAMLGAASPDELLDRPILDLVPPEDRARIAARAGNASAGATNARLEQQLVRLDGVTIDVEISGMPFPLAEEAVLIVVRDVSERKASAERFRATFEQTAVGMAHVDLNGRWLRVNRKLCELSGYSHEELLAISYHQMTHPEDLGVEKQRAEALLRGETDSYSLEKRYIRKDGLTVWVALTVSLVRKPDGSPDYFIAAIKGIDDRKAAEDALRQNEERYRSLLAHGAEVILILDRDGTILWISDSVEPALAWRPQQLQLRSAFEYLHPDDLAGGAVVVEQVLSDPRTAVQAGWRIRHAHGGWRDMEMSVMNMLERPEVGGIVLNARDVTSRNRLQRDFDQMRRVDSLGRVAANVAHEFNNVLLGIDSLAQALARRAGENDSALKAIRGAVQRGKHITADILRYARPAELAAETFLLEPWLRQVADELKALLSARHPLQLTFDEALPSIRGDRQQLAQVVVNLVLNARDAMTDGGTIALEARHSEFFGGARLLPGEQAVDIVVRDRGAGIPEELLPNIFEPLFTTKKSGTGLGLAIAQQIVARHHGLLSVESAVGSGTTFCISLPARM